VQGFVGEVAGEEDGGDGSEVIVSSVRMEIEVDWCSRDEVCY
jgi:hypothetical protein